VVVAAEPVALTKVKFWRVDDPVRRRFAKVLSPENELVSESRVEEAAVIVMFAVPSKETPLIVLAVSRAVAVPALPEIEPVIVLEKVLLPEKVLLSTNRVDDDTPEIAPQVTSPADETFRALDPEQGPAAMYRLEVEAVVAKILVVVAADVVDLPIVR